MRKCLFIFAALLFWLPSFAQQASQAKQNEPAQAKQNGPVITWEKNTHDFGDIHEGDKVEQTFKFTNTGNEPLIISNIQVTCGCTTPKWPKDPVPPGGKGEVVVGFNSTGKHGLQNKTVTLQCNAVNDATNITFKVNVLDKKTAE